MSAVGAKQPLPSVSAEYQKGTKSGHPALLRSHPIEVKRDEIPHLHHPRYIGQAWFGNLIGGITETFGQRVGFAIHKRVHERSLAG